MIRITDITFSCLGVWAPSDDQLRQLFCLLDALGTDFIEMPSNIYARIAPPLEKLVLRITMPEEAAAYPDIPRFVCRHSGQHAPPEVMQELQLNDMREIARFGRDESLKNVRIVGLDDILNSDYPGAFDAIKSRAPGRVEFCPENSYSCATAAGVEWIIAGGSALAASFGGLGGKAATEEILLSLRVVRRHKPTASYSVLPQIATLIEEITKQRFGDRKAVIGRNIFNVESGIHVDGILKKPQMYEPFLPELVGSSRRLVIGKHSGRKSIAAKLAEMDYQSGDFDISRLLGAVRSESVSKKASLTDEEFDMIAQKYRIPK